MVSRPRLTGDELPAKGANGVLSVHTMTGDPGDLMARKGWRMDPVAAGHAGRLGALWPVTACQDDGIVTCNPWEPAAGFTRLPEAVQM